MFDTHSAVKTLTGAGASDELAEAFVRVAQDARELAGVRTEIANFDTRSSTQIADLRTKQRIKIARIQTDVTESRAEVESLVSRLVK